MRLIFAAVLVVRLPGVGSVELRLGQLPSKSDHADFNTADGLVYHGGTTKPPTTAPPTTAPPTVPPTTAPTTTTAAATPLVFRTYGEAMGHILVLDGEVTKIAKAASQEQYAMAALESRVTDEEVRFSSNNEAWDTLNHEAAANSQRTAFLGAEVEALAKRFEKLGGLLSESTRKFKHLKGIAAEPSATAHFVAVAGHENPTKPGNQLSRLEAIISSSTPGSDLMTRLQKVANDENSYREGIKAQLQTAVKTSLRGLADETRRALHNLTATVTEKQLEPHPCDPC